MCSTVNKGDAKSCKSCGYSFEDFDVADFNSNPSPAQWAPKQPTSSGDSFPVSDSSAEIISGSSPLFVVSKSIFSLLTPGILYLVFILFVTFSGGTDYTSLGLIVVFVLLAVLPIFFTARRFEFYDNSLRMVKPIGGASGIPYSDLMIEENFSGRRRRIVLYSLGQRRRNIVIPGNPTNTELGEDLDHFLQKKVPKQPSSEGKSLPQPSDSNSSEDMSENDTSKSS